MSMVTWYLIVLSVVVYGLVDWKHLERLLDSAETMREETQERLASSEPIYSTYTHLVCRKARPGPKMVDNVVFTQY